MQSADLRKVGDQRFGHAVREILLIGIAGEILQRQNCQGADLRRNRMIQWHPAISLGYHVEQSQQQNGGACSDRVNFLNRRGLTAAAAGEDAALCMDNRLRSARISLAH